MLEELFHSVLSTSGIVGALLFGALVWQTRELARLRDQREKDREQELAARVIESDRRVTAFAEMGKALGDISRVLTQLTERVRG